MLLYWLPVVVVALALGSSSSVLGLTCYGSLENSNLCKEGDVYLIGETRYSIPSDHRPLLSAVDAQAAKVDAQGRRVADQGTKMSVVGQKMGQVQMPEGRRQMIRLRAEMRAEQRQMRAEQQTLRAESKALRAETRKLEAKVSQDLRSGKLRPVEGAGSDPSAQVTQGINQGGNQGVSIVSGSGTVNFGNNAAYVDLTAHSSAAALVLGPGPLVGIGRTSKGEHVSMKGDKYIVGATVYTIPADHLNYITSVQERINTMQRLGNNMRNIGANMREVGRRMGAAWRSGTQQAVQAEMNAAQSRMDAEQAKMTHEEVKLEEECTVVVAKIEADIANGKMIPDQQVQSGREQAVFVQSGPLIDYGQRPNGEQVSRRGNQYIIGGQVYKIPADHQPLLDAVQKRSEKMQQIGQVMNGIGADMNAIGAQMSMSWSGAHEALRRQMAAAQARMNTEKWRMSEEGVKLREDNSALMKKIDEDITTGKLLPAGTTLQAIVR